MVEFPPFSSKVDGWSFDFPPTCSEINDLTGDFLPKSADVDGVREKKDPQNVDLPPNNSEIELAKEKPKRVKRLHERCSLSSWA